MQFSPKSPLLLCLAAAWVGASPGSGAAVPPAAAAMNPDVIELFENKIRPLLIQRCYECHSTTTGQAQGGLRLDSRDGLLKGGDSGPAITPGQPENSLLIKAVNALDSERPGPPRHRLPAIELADLADWVKLGAPDPRASPPTGPAPAAASIAHWSFVAPKDPALPEIKNKRWPQNGIDRFVLSRLEAKSLTPNIAADKRTLLRRATYDLTGLPPTVEEIEAFTTDVSPGAFGEVIDRLLASSRYGERWGRHWLDLARYADTAGESADYPVPLAYKYRDYVIEAFNQDKPYDQFLREQIAGDLLPDETGNKRDEGIIATGFIAIARRFSVAPETAQHLTIEDTLDTLGRTVLGLSLSCARCHDHKYDPIPTQDYYALYGIFSSTRYPFPGSEEKMRPRHLVPLGPPGEAKSLLQPFDEKLAALDAEIRRLEKESALLSKEGLMPGEELRDKLIESKAQREELIATAPVIEKAYAVAEGTPANARVQRRGEPGNLAEEVPRHFLTVLGGQPLPPDARGSGRLELASWLTDTKNPLTARVMVNRIWQHHFGKGLVTTPSDFGARGRPPTHPELLDYLALRFIESGWSVKAMHKLIMLSQTYQQSSGDNAAGLNRDPENELLWKFNRRRLDAEEIRDAMLFLGGDLEEESGGPHPFPAESDWVYTQHNQFTAVYENHRRSVYLMQQRIKKHPFLATFDGADPNSSTAERVISTTPLQALFLLNDKFAHEQSDKFAARLCQSCETPARCVELAWQLAYGRPPRAGELRAGEAYLEKLRAKLAHGNAPPDAREQQSWASFARALLASNEFIYVD